MEYNLPGDLILAKDVALRWQNRKQSVKRQLYELKSHIQGFWWTHLALTPTALEERSIGSKLVWMTNLVTDGAHLSRRKTRWWIL
jgi:hypothetical protein